MIPGDLANPEVHLFPALGVGRASYESLGRSDRWSNAIRRLPLATTESSDTCQPVSTSQRDRQGDHGAHPPRTMVK